MNRPDDVANRTTLPRILQVNSLLTGGGTDEQCARTVEVLRGLGQEVRIIGPAGSAFSERLGKSGIYCETSLRQRKGLFALRVARCIREYRPGIIHAHHGRDYWPTIFAGWISGMRPKIVLSRHLAKRPGSVGSRFLLLRCCDALVAVSEFVARVLREGVYEPNSLEEERRARPRLYGDRSKVAVIYPGIDTGLFRPLEGSPLRREWKVEPEHFVFGVAGVYNEPRGKGQRKFLEAAARVHQVIPEARFLLIGRGTMAQTLRNDINRLGLKGKAWLTPFCAEMPQAMNAIDCLAHPAIGTEAFGLVMAEAQACGRPVIGANLDGIPETIVDSGAGTLFPPGSVDALAEELLRWARRERWTMARRYEVHAAVARKFSLQRAGEQLCQLYSRL